MTDMQTKERELVTPVDRRGSVRASRPPGPSTTRGRIWQAVISEPAFTILTFLIDAVMASVAVGIALTWSEAAGVSRDHAGELWLFIPLALGWFSVRGLYKRELRARFLDDLEPLVGTISLSAITLLALMLVLDDHPRPGALVVRLWLVAVVLMSLGRLTRALLQRHGRRRCRVGAPALIIGGGQIAHQIARRLDELPEYGLRPAGLLHHELPLREGDDIPPRIGAPEDLVKASLATRAEHLIVAFSSDPDENHISAARAGHALGMEVSVVPRLFDAVGERVRVEHLGGLPILYLDRINPRGWQFAVKHAMDRTLAAIALILLSPVLITLAISVRLSSPGPILFRQRRVGRDGQPFDLLKFRSMRMPREADAAFELRKGAAPGGVEGDDRRTRIGTFMRRTSLDELPQLINILRGDMSLVGPRPERPEFVELFQEQIRRYGERHRVKAGLTGWAQVHGLRGQTSIADRAEWDNYYIENWSLRLDLKILALTFLTLFRRSED